MRRIFYNFLAFLGGTVLLTIVISMIGYTYIKTSRAKVPENSYLEISLEGALKETAAQKDLQSLFGARPTLGMLIQALDHASQDPRITGVILRLNNFSAMGLGQIQEIRAALKRVAAHGKKTFAYTDTFGENTSGMGLYYLASACKELWMQPLGSLNITGLSVEMPFIRQFLNEYGIKAQILRREEYKTAMDFLTHDALSPQNRENLESILTTSFKQIIGDIAQDRNIKPELIKEYVDNAPLVEAQSAKDKGLINCVGYIEELYGNLTQGKHLMPPLIQFEDYIQSLPTREGKDKIAIIYIAGAIMRTSSTFNPLTGQSVSAEEIRKAFQEALRDPSVKAIVLRINSPGGSAAASDTVWYAVKRAKDKGIPVIVSMGDVAASGGYMAALPATKIVANPATLTGSIGVYIGKIASNTFWEKLKIHWESVQVGRRALMWNSIKEYSADEQESINQSLDTVYNVFMSRVADARKLTRLEVHKVAQGQVWTGEEALKLGLIDGLGDMTAAIKMAKKEAGFKEDTLIKLETFPREISVINRIKQLLQGDLSSTHVKGFLIDIFISLKSYLRGVTGKSLYSPVAATLWEE